MAIDPHHDDHVSTTRPIWGVVGVVIAVIAVLVLIGFFGGAFKGCGYGPIEVGEDVGREVGETVTTLVGGVAYEVREDKSLVPVNDTTAATVSDTSQYVTKQDLQDMIKQMQTGSTAATPTTAPAVTGTTVAPATGTTVAPSAGAVDSSGNPHQPNQSPTDKSPGNPTGQSSVNGSTALYLPTGIATGMDFNYDIAPGDVIIFKALWAKESGVKYDGLLMAIAGPATGSIYDFEGEYVIENKDAGRAKFLTMYQEMIDGRQARQNPIPLAEWGIDKAALKAGNTNQ